MSPLDPAARAALAYMARGWAPTPVRPRSKIPLLAAWPRRRLGQADLHLFSGRNVGLVLGSDGGGLVDIDCDWPEAATLAHDILPATDLVHGRPSSPHSHFWYQSDAKAEVFGLPDSFPGRKPVVVELRSRGLMTVVPPSTHPSGEVLAWERWGTPAVIHGAELHRSVGRLATAAVLVCVLGWSKQEALAQVLGPAARSLKALERRYGTGLPLRAWLGEGRCSKRCGRARPTGPAGGLAPGRSSSLTEAVLTLLGGVGGAARLLGLPLREGRQPCPFHRGRSTRSLQITGHVWRCWAGCGSGNAIHLAACVLELSYRDARSWLAASLGLPRS